MTDAAIYTHVPFCVKKCAYCDFESRAGALIYADEYIENVVREAEQVRREYGNINITSVYIGGGTPSILTPEQIFRLINGILKPFSINETVEISMEANPGTLDIEKLRAAREAKVNRLSLGAQSANENELKMLGRIHSWAEVEAAVTLARGAGFDNINIDLMYALPNQTNKDLDNTIKRAVELSPEHISCYSLICEEGTVLTKRILSGELTEASDEVSVEMLAMIVRELHTYGYHRYEISNYALANRECEHNKAYWTRKNYIGLGCAAHSLMNNARYANPSFDSYMKGERAATIQTLTKIDILEENIMLSTRTTQGIDVCAFERDFGVAASFALQSEAALLQNMELAVIKPERIFLTDKGFDVQNAIVYRLVERIEAAI